MAGKAKVDPRRMSPEKYRAYQQRVKKVKRNRRILALSVFAFVMIITVGILSLTVLFKADTINVNGQSIYKPEQIIEASDIKLQQNLFRIGKKYATEAIPQKLPYISSAEISIKLPSTVNITVKPTAASCYFVSSNGCMLCDSSTKVLAAVSADKVPKNIAKLVTKSPITGETAGNFTCSDENETELIKTIFESIEKSGIKDITLIDITEPSTIKMTYQNRFRLNIGTKSRLTYKLSSAVEIIKKEDQVSTLTSGEIFLSKPGSAYVTPDKT